MSKQVFIITTAVNNTNINKNFLQTMELYAKHNKAKIIVIPTKYNPLLLKKEEIVYDESIEKYIKDTSFEIGNNVMVLAGVNISPTAKRPLTSMVSMGLNQNTIIPHTRLHEETLPTLNKNEDTKKIMTTGAITEPNYTISKLGATAKFHHTYGFVVVEVESNCRIFMRQVHANKDGSFNDLYLNYSINGIKPSKVEAIVFGDIHEMFLSPVVKEKGIFGKASLLNTLKPRKVILHDVFDCYTASHHNENNIFKKYQISKTGKSLIDEIKSSKKFFNKISKLVEEVIIINSNHDNHLVQYLERTLRNGYKGSFKDIKDVLKMQYLMIDEIDKMDNENDLDPKIPDMFGLIMKMMCKRKDKLNFLKPNQSYILQNFELGLHGHAGINGSRSLNNIHNKISTKFIAAHSHSALRLDGYICVGTSSILDRGYTNGLSTWSHTHAIIYQDGKAQLITQHPSDGEYTSNKKTKSSIKKGDSLMKDIEEVSFINHHEIPDEQDVYKKYKITSTKDGTTIYVNGRYEAMDKLDKSEWYCRTLITNGSNTHHKCELNPFFKEKREDDVNNS